MTSMTLFHAPEEFHTYTTSILNSLFGKGNIDELAVFWDDILLHEINEGRMRGKPTRMRGITTRGRIQMLHDLANDGG